MKVYQIHEYGGCWEDSYDNIRFTYLDPVKATTKKRELEIVEELSGMCDSCPLWFCPKNCIEDCNKCGGNGYVKIIKAKKYCDRCNANVDEEGEIECANNASHYDESRFRIEEIDVIE